jgi:hypothetical protein
MMLRLKNILNPDKPVTAIRKVHLLILIIVLTTAILILYPYFLLLRTDIEVIYRLWSNRDAFMSAVKHTVAMTPFVLFASLMIVFWIKRFLISYRLESENQEGSNKGYQPRFMLFAWSAGIVAVLVMIGGTSVYVDPRDMYGTNFYAPWGVSVREAKVAYYRALGQMPDVLIFGSSHVFPFPPARITEKLGYSAFNMGVTSGKINDFWMLTRFILEQDNKRLPRVILMEIEYPFGVGKDYTATFSPLNLLPYMDDYTRRKALQVRLEGLLDIGQFAESLFAANLENHYGKAINYQIHPDGWTTAASQPTQEQFDSEVKISIGNIRSGCAINTDPEGEKLLREYLVMAQQYGSTVILLRAPYHPLFIQAQKKLIPRYEECEAAQIRFFIDLTREYPNVIFLDYHDVDKFGGDDTIGGFYDPFHLTIDNATKLIDHLLNSIQEGSQLAALNPSTKP